MKVDQRATESNAARTSISSLTCVLAGCRKGKRDCIYPEPPRQSRVITKPKEASEDVDSSEEERDGAAIEGVKSGQGEPRLEQFTQAP